MNHPVTSRHPSLKKGGGKYRLKRTLSPPILGGDAEGRGGNHFTFSPTNFIGYRNKYLRLCYWQTHWLFLYPNYKVY